MKITCDSATDTRRRCATAPMASDVEALDTARAVRVIGAMRAHDAELRARRREAQAVRLDHVSSFSICRGHMWSRYFFPRLLDFSFSPRAGETGAVRSAGPASPGSGVGA